MKLFKVLCITTSLLLAFTFPAISATVFDQGFETGTDGWIPYSGTITQTASGTDGITSAAGVITQMLPGPSLALMGIGTPGLAAIPPLWISISIPTGLAEAFLNTLLHPAGQMVIICRISSFMLQRMTLLVDFFSLVTTTLTGIVL